VPRSSVSDVRSSAVFFPAFIPGVSDGEVEGTEIGLSFSQDAIVLSFLFERCAGCQNSFFQFVSLRPPVISTFALLFAVMSTRPLFRVASIVSRLLDLT